MKNEKLKKAAEFILAEAGKQGADPCQCAVTEKETKEFNVDGGDFSLMRTLFDYSVNITVIKDNKKGNVIINRLDEEALKQAVCDCIASAESAKPDTAWELYAEKTEEEYVQGEPDCNTEKLFERSKEIKETIGNDYPTLMVEQMITSHERVETQYMNTHGVSYATLAGFYEFSVGVNAHVGDKTSSMAYTGIRTEHLDKPVIELGGVRRMLIDTEKQLDTVPVSGKFTGTLVMTPNFSQMLVYLLDACFTGDGPLLEGTSMWKDKLGDLVASDSLSIRVAPSDACIACGQKYTGEGYPAKDYDLIKDGILKSFSLSQYAANRTKNKRAGNTSSAYIIPGGDKSVDEIIAGIDKGILVDRFSGGAPGANGEFSGVAKGAFMIENGKITDALSETMISGNILEGIKNIRAISRETMEDGAMSTPYIAMEGITISGK